MRTCIKCEIAKPDGDFYNFKPLNKCKKCILAYNRDREIAKIARTLFKCKTCDERKPASAFMLKADGVRSYTCLDCIDKKKCRYCKVVKHISEFGMHKNLRCRVDCRNCEAIQYEAWQERNREKNHAIEIPDKEKLCGACGRTLRSTDFSLCVVTYDGLAKKCRECSVKDNRKYRNKLGRKGRKLKDFVTSARARAKRRNFDFDLDDVWVVEQFANVEFCPIFSDIQLDWDASKYSGISPTLDRFDSSKGYTKDNVWVISALANTMKSNATFEQLLVFADFWKQALAGK